MHATLVSGGSKASHVSNDAAPKSHKGGIAVQSALQRLVPNLLQDIKRLVLLPVRQDYMLYLQLAVASFQRCITPAQQRSLAFELSN